VKRRARGRAAAGVGALIVALAACRFGGPSGSPLTYVALGDDAASASDAEDVEAATAVDAPAAEVSDASIGEASIEDASMTDALITDTSAGDASVDDAAPVDGAPADAPSTDALESPETSIEAGGDLG
jgi:hypothetical protein